MYKCKCVCVRKYICIIPTKKNLVQYIQERDKRRSSPTENKAMGPPPRKGTYYGPSPDTLFKITHTPGKITLVDRAVTREVNPTQTEKLSRRGSALFQSLRRYGSRQNEECDTHSISSPSSEFSQATYFTSQSCNDLYFQSKPAAHLERHPLQFICSVATRNLTNLHFEAETPEEKDVWCQHMESVLEEHVQRNQQQAQNSSSNKEQGLSPTNSTYSFESISSAESVAFAPSWTGYCDVETMDIDDVDGQQQQPAVTSAKEEASNGLDKSQDLLQTIMGEFGDTIWSMGSPAGMSPYQIRQSFSNVGS